MARMCKDCGIPMIEQCEIEAVNEDSKLIVKEVGKKRWLGGAKRLHAAVCPKCGEVSLYLDRIDCAIKPLDGRRERKP